MIGALIVAALALWVGVGLYALVAKASKKASVRMTPAQEQEFEL